jgi:hypothetical protein
MTRTAVLAPAALIVLPIAVFAAVAQRLPDIPWSGIFSHSEKARLLVTNTLPVRTGPPGD